MVRNNRGFTLIEVIVVAAIIAILAGILVPMIFSQIDESKITRAQGDVKTIATAISRYRMDTGYFPKINPAVAIDPAVGPVTAYETLFSLGVQLALPAGFLTTIGDLGDNLSPGAAAKNVYTTGGFFEKKWKGPYLSTFTSDPWGNAYVVNVVNDTAEKNVWVLSAGPNGVFDTDSTSSQLQKDDIGVIVGNKSN